MKKIIALLIFIFLVFLLITNFNFIMYKISFFQQLIVEKIAFLIEEKRIEIFYIILFLTFVYGLIHSIGPGHGKTIIMTYSLKEKLSTKKIFFLSFIIAYLESIMAYLIVKFLIDLTSRNSMKLFYNLDNQTRLIASIFIIIIGLYNFFTLFKEKNCDSYDKKYGEKKNIFYLALVLGLCPCPGVMSVLLFLESFDYGENLFLFALSAATGIFLIIFLSGILITRFKNIFIKEKDGSLQRNLSYLGAFFLIIFGGLQIYIIL